VYLAAFRDVKQRRQTKSLKTRNEGEASSYLRLPSGVLPAGPSNPADVPPQYAHPTALPLYFDALDQSSVDVDEDGTATVEVGGLTGELPSYSSGDLDQKCRDATRLIEKHVSKKELRQELIEILKSLNLQRRQAGG
jgi:hypothetical protein